MMEQERYFKGLIHACNEGYAIAVRNINNKRYGRRYAYNGAPSYVERRDSSYQYTDVVPIATVMLSMSHNTSLVRFLNNVGVPRKKVDELVDSYFLGNTDNILPLYDDRKGEAMCWLWNPNGKVSLNDTWNDKGRFVRRKTIGGVVDANIIIVDEATGKVLRYSQYHVIYTIGWFGGNLLGVSEHRDKDVYVVQEEVTALLGAVVIPTALWIALGHGQDMTDEHLHMLGNRRVVLFPDDMTLDFWREMAQGHHNMKVIETFALPQQNGVVIDINKYFISMIKKTSYGYKKAT